MKVNIITKNPGKILAAKSLFNRYNIETFFIEKDYPEIKADTSIEIAKFTALNVAKELNISIIREDHSFFLNAWGVPGPYMNYAEFFNLKMKQEHLRNIRRKSVQVFGKETTKR